MKKNLQNLVNAGILLTAVSLVAVKPIRERIVRHIQYLRAENTATIYYGTNFYSTNMCESYRTNK